MLNLDDPIVSKIAPKLKSKVLFFSRTQQVENGACVENGKVVLRRTGRRSPCATRT